MVQYKKQEIKELIDSAALKVFAEKGYQNTKITDISQSSGVSVGNIYKYYKGKEEIFCEVMPEDFVSVFKEKLTHKIISWKERNERSLDKTIMNDQFLDFITENRQVFLILLTGSKGTKYENLRGELVDYLAAVFIKGYEGELCIDITDTENIDLIKLIYEKHIEMIASLLISETKEMPLSKKLKFVNEYHMYGITNFLKASKAGGNAE